MFKSTIVFALALLSVADGKRILRGEKERTQQEKRQFTLSTKDKESEVFHLKPGQEISAHGVRRLLAEDKQQRHRRELRGGNGGNGGSGSGSGSSSSGSSDEPEWFFNIDDLANVVTLTGLSGDIINFIPTVGAQPGIEGICTSTSCIGVLAATAEGYDCDPDGDEFEDSCLDVVVANGGGGGVVDFRCPEATDVMRIQSATCVCIGNPPTGSCTASTTILLAGTSYVIPPAVANTCGGAGQSAISATLVCESVIAGSSSSSSSGSSSSGSSTGSSGSSTGKSSSTTNRRQ